MIWKTVKRQGQCHALDFANMKLVWNFVMESSACGFSDKKEYTVRRCNH